MSRDPLTLVQEVGARLREAGAPPPAVGVILGSGLGGLADAVEGPAVVDLASVEGWPRSSVEGHAGRLVAGTIGETPVWLAQGRVHLYEGHDLVAAGLPARLLCAQRPQALVLTNAAGGIRRGFTPGTLMLIHDHLNLQGGSPLEGPNEEAWGPRFPDQSEVYPSNLRHLAREEAARLEFTLEEGVYAAVRGPQYETPAEIRMLERLGADAVGMSTAPEAICAAHMNVPVLGISLITNLAAGIGEKKLDHEEVLAEGARAGQRLEALLRRLLPRLARSGPTR
jgi:purine-nucleoside phosphorylase